MQSTLFSANFYQPLAQKAVPTPPVECRGIFVRIYFNCKCKVLQCEVTLLTTSWTTGRPAALHDLGHKHELERRVAVRHVNHRQTEERHRRLARPQRHWVDGDRQLLACQRAAV